MIPFNIAIKEFKENKKDFYSCSSKIKFVTPSGFNLGVWVTNQKTKYKNNKLPLDKIEQLNKAGIIWTYHDENEKFDQIIILYTRYNKKYHLARNKTDYITPSGFKLGVWISRQKVKYKNNQLSSYQIEKLNSAGIVLTNSCNTKDKGINHFLEYINTYNTPNIAYGYCSPDGFLLGLWASRQRKKYKNKELSQAVIDKLNKAGFVWSKNEIKLYDSIDLKRDDLFNKGYSELLSYIKNSEDSNLYIPCNFIKKNGFKLGKWALLNRTRYKKNILTKRELALLNKVSFVWELSTAYFNKGIKHYKYFVLKENKHRVPRNYVSADGYKLGEWCNIRRVEHKKGKLKQEKFRQLDALGFIWGNAQCFTGKEISAS